MSRNSTTWDMAALSPLPFVYEYGRLAMQPKLSLAERNRLDEILDMALDDGVLNYWIMQVDYFVAYKLGDLTNPNLEQLENQVAWLREYLETRIPPNN